MPGLKVCTTGSFPLTSLIHRTKLVIVHFKKWNNSLTFTIGARNMTTRSTNGSPTTA